MPYLNCASYLSIPEVPMLFIHGDADKLVHWEMMEKTYFAFPKGQKLASTSVVVALPPGRPLSLNPPERILAYMPLS